MGDDKKITKKEKIWYDIRRKRETERGDFSSSQVRKIFPNKLL